MLLLNHEFGHFIMKKRSKRTNLPWSSPVYQTASRSTDRDWNKSSTLGSYSTVPVHALLRQAWLSMADVGSSPSQVELRGRYTANFCLLPICELVLHILPSRCMPGRVQRISIRQSVQLMPHALQNASQWRISPPFLYSTLMKWRRLEWNQRFIRDTTLHERTYRQ